MPFTNASNTNPEAIKIHYEDLGQGQPVVLIHGWPVSKEMWEYQKSAILDAGYRCISYDRRGFGQSDKPLAPYNYDVFADDLNQLIEELQLQDVILTGFSMGGGEVVRYMGRFGTGRIAKAVLISTVVPLVVKTETHPDGVPQEALDEMITNVKNDRPAFLKEFGKQFFGVSLISNPVSDGIQQWMFGLALPASGIATAACITAFGTTNFKNDLPAVNVPTLIIHGDHDKIVPIEATSHLTAEGIANCEYKVYQGAPHGLFITQKEQLNKDLLEFFRKEHTVAPLSTI